MATDFKTFIAEAIKASPAEATTIRKVVCALKAAGTPIVKVYDGEEFVNVKTEQDILNEAFNLDWCRLYTEDNSWVFIVMGNEWDALSDYTLDLEDALAPVNEYLATKG